MAPFLVVMINVPKYLFSCYRPNFSTIRPPGRIVRVRYSIQTQDIIISWNCAVPYPLVSHYSTSTCACTFFEPSNFNFKKIFWNFFFEIVLKFFFWNFFWELHDWWWPVLAILSKIKQPPDRYIFVRPPWTIAAESRSWSANSPPSKGSRMGRTLPATLCVGMDFRSTPMHRRCFPASWPRKFHRRKRSSALPFFSLFIRHGRGRDIIWRTFTCSRSIKGCGWEKSYLPVCVGLRWITADVRCVCPCWRRMREPRRFMSGWALKMERWMKAGNLAGSDWRRYEKSPAAEFNEKTFHFFIFSHKEFPLIGLDLSSTRKYTLHGVVHLFFIIMLFDHFYD